MFDRENVSLGHLFRRLAARQFVLGTLLATGGCGSQRRAGASAEPLPVDRDVAVAVEADWAAQETRAGREPGSRESIDAALQRGEQLLASLVPIAGAAALESHARSLHALAVAVERGATLTDEQRLALYYRLRWTGRQWR